MSDSLYDRFPQELRAAGDVFPAPPDTLIERGIARGRQMRRRRAVPALATLAVAAVAAVVIALPSGGAGPVSHPSASGGVSVRGVNVDLAAWSVHTNADASVTVTIHQLLDPDALRGVLAKADVRADVHFIKAQWRQPVCLPGTDTPGVTEAQAERVLGIGDPRSTQVSRDLASVIIHPAAMPAGSWISFVLVDWGPAHPMMISIEVLARAPQPCAGVAK